MKFRVWDSEQKEFVTTINELSKEHFFVINSNGELLTSFFVFGTQNETVFELSDKKYTPVFSAGQTDRSGIESYEGDMIKIHGNRSIHGHCVGDIMEIHWSGSGFFPLCIPGDYGCGCLESTDIEIIGSKYENPELLES